MEVTVSRTASWFCLRTHHKHEHIAAAQLGQDPELEVFLPRIRYLRSTRFGAAWVTEALFQNYLFVRFDLTSALRRVRHARGVRSVVHFGDRWPTIPQTAIDELRNAMDGAELRTVENVLRPGDEVEINSGAMRGLQAVVSSVMPAKQRVAVLLDFLGRQTMVELDRNQITCTAEDQHRRVCFSAWDQAGFSMSA
jgi:transcriptional antiterminator RfaH